MRDVSGCMRAVWQTAFGIGTICLPLTDALAADFNAAAYDNGDRLLVSYHMKVEHRAVSPADNVVHQLGTPEGRKILAGLATFAGVDPTVANLVAAAIPLPTLNRGATDNHPFYEAPSGMMICKAGPGYMEASHATWEANIVRDGKQNGLAVYTSVGTSPGATHRIQGDFSIEFVKPVEGWEGRFGCMPNGAQAWRRHDD